MKLEDIMLKQNKPNREGQIHLLREQILNILTTHTHIYTGKYVS